MDNMDVMKEYYDALCDDRIRAYFQPVYFIGENSRMVSAEALCRIRLKDGSILTPDQFIPGLERTGEILTLDWIMIDKACSMALDIAAETDSDITISVNFSGAHVNEWDAVERLCSIVDSYYVDHDQIEIEITETYKADDFMLNFLMKRLRSEGFRVAIDDFGEGYNSLKLIKDVDFDTIKIDRSFVQNTGIDNSDAIIRGIVEMADNLGVRTIAEGVENSRHAVNVVCNGCNFIQGNYLMEPVPEEDFISFILDEENHGRANNESVHA
ncbi:MAG: EAL domain-containing protein [Lachnospiraceae bacterium]|nr:EAL domain-containing protein [Lachnospiraceae bacterium]